jgi:cytochrome P450 family 135
LPSAVQTGLLAAQPYTFLRTCQRRYGDVFRLRLGLPGGEIPGAVVYIADPATIKAVFAIDGLEGHAGAANTVLKPVTGAHSLLQLDREEHLKERRLLSPAFHGESLQRLEEVIREASEREIATWAEDGVFAMRPAMQRITFEVIMRAVLSAEDRALQERLMEAFEPVFNLSTRQMIGLIPALRVDLGKHSPWGRLRLDLARLDETLLDLISTRRTSGPQDDILGLLLSATDEDGEGLSDRHIRDELVTLLLVGHETTATALAWAFERLARHPSVITWARRGVEEGTRAPLDAVAAETLRVRPIVTDVARRLSDEVEIGGYALPAETTVVSGIYLVHFDSRNHEDPESFRPERFENRPPSAETWLPFGGGRRRCVGAALAQMEMRIVLETVLRDYVPEPSSPTIERPRLRGITFAPEDGARLRMRRAPLAQMHAATVA